MQEAREFANPPVIFRTSRIPPRHHLHLLPLRVPLAVQILIEPQLNVRLVLVHRPVRLRLLLVHLFLLRVSDHPPRVHSVIVDLLVALRRCPRKLLLLFARRAGRGRAVSRLGARHGGRGRRPGEGLAVLLQVVEEADADRLAREVALHFDHEAHRFRHALLVAQPGSGERGGG